MSLRSYLRTRFAPDLHQAARLTHMRRSFRTVRGRQRRADIPDLEERKARLREVREASVGNQALLDRALARLKDNGIRVHRAATKEEALALVAQEVGAAPLVVKSKSNVTKEIGLTEFLEGRGVAVVETDIGDRIIQLAGDKPSHPTGPALHLSRHDIARIVSEHLGKPVATVPETLAGVVRDDIDSAINEATIGVTGANAIVAEEGMVVLWHNEGNIWKVMMRPGKHIVLAGLDKVYPNLDEAMNLARVQAFQATGQVAPTFINVVGGPSRTGDIELLLVKGVHGPSEVVLVLVDNGRSRIQRSEFQELLYCIGCGACLLECPAYGVYGPQFAHGVELGGRGLLTASLTRRSAGEALDLCLTCGRCRKLCPLDIDVPGMISRLRATGSWDKAWHFLDAHGRWAGASIQLETLLLMRTVLGGEQTGPRNSQT